MIRSQSRSSEMRNARRATRQAVVALAKCADELRVSFGQALGHRLLEPAIERALLGRAPEVQEAVVREPNERRGEDGDERLVVVAIVQEPQVGEQVDDLLLVVVVAAGRAERGQPELAQRLLV